MKSSIVLLFIYVLSSLDKTESFYNRMKSTKKFNMKEFLKTISRKENTPEEDAELMKMNDPSLSFSGTNVCRRSVRRMGVMTYTTRGPVPYKYCCGWLVWGRYCVDEEWCTGYRMGPVKKTRKRMIPKQILYCCYGYTKEDPDSKHCTKAICKSECLIGKCVAPNRCQYNPKETRLSDFKKIINEDKCSYNISTSSSANVTFLHSHNPLFEMQHCTVNVYIVAKENKTSIATVTIRKFNINSTLNCGESLVTMATSDQHIFHYCSNILPDEEQSFRVNATRLTFENTQSRWSTNEEVLINIEVENKENMTTGQNRE
eukprot:TCONS_00023857-protein